MERSSQTSISYVKLYKLFGKNIILIHKQNVIITIEHMLWSRYVKSCENTRHLLWEAHGS